MSNLRPDNPIQYLRGVGPQRAAALATLGVNTVLDLLEYYPFRHEAHGGPCAIADLVLDEHADIRGTITHVRVQPHQVTCRIDDGTGECVLRWFNQTYTGRRLFRGANVIASGRVQMYDDLPAMVQPHVQVFAPDTPVTLAGGGPGLVGVYRGNAQMKSGTIRRVIEALLTEPRLPVDECLPPTLRASRGLVTREQAIRQMHAPRTEEELAGARARLAYEELLLMELALALRRRKLLATQHGQRLHVTPEIDARIRARFPFPLTASQDEVIREIAGDLQSGRPMTRLLQGDVGSGKTVVALYACLVTVASGRQAAIMAPTEILARQHALNVERYLAGSRVRHVLLRGGLPARTRADALAAIERGEIDLVIGTQALIQKDVAFNQLAVVVVDEQHKFGVLQRHEFRTKGPGPHYLVMTATPIPRTLAMTVFGDLDVSVIRHSPPGRGRIATRVVTSGQWDTVMHYVRTRLEAGEQAYVVCPRIGPPEPAKAGEADRGEDETKADIRSAVETFEQLRTGPWSDLPVGLLHGGLRSADKAEAIRAFAAGELKALVATTVVEVGVDVPNATIMVIEHADRFGLSQLHQLRGRVGRGTRDSLCVLIARARGPKTRARLDVMTETTDGFRIAEADLEQRGPGELFGTRQHGLPELHVASITGDFALLEQARTDAFALVAADPELRRPEHQGLWVALRRFFAGKLSLIDAA